MAIFGLVMLFVAARVALVGIHLCGLGGFWAVLGSVLLFAPCLAAGFSVFYL
jgi:hypothetical protein